MGFEQLRWHGGTSEQHSQGTFLQASFARFCTGDTVTRHVNANGFYSRRAAPQAVTCAPRATVEKR